MRSELVACVAVDLVPCFLLIGFEARAAGAFGGAELLDAAFPEVPEGVGAVLDVASLVVVDAFVAFADGGDADAGAEVAAEDEGAGGVDDACFDNGGDVGPVIGCEAAEFELAFREEGGFGDEVVDLVVVEAGVKSCFDFSRSDGMADAMPEFDVADEGEGLCVGAFFDEGEGVGFIELDSVDVVLDGEVVVAKAEDVGVGGGVDAEVVEAFFFAP